MAQGKHKPQLSDAVERREVDGDAVLYHRQFETQLLVRAEMAPILAQIDGEHSLDELELTAASHSSGLAYQELMLLLYSLWDRGMLADAGDLSGLLFPNKRFRSVDHVRAAHRLRKLVSWKVYSRRLGKVLGVWGGLGRLLSATPCLFVAALLALGGVVMQLSGVVSAPERLLSYNGSWLLGIGLAYGALCLSLSVRGVVRAAVLTALGPGVPAAGLHITAGVIYFDVDCREVAYLTRDRGFRFALSGLLAISTLAAAAAVGHWLGGPDWLLHLAAIAQLATFLDLCPFMATDGARLVELSSALSGQERRVGSYIGRKLLHDVFGGDDPEATRFSIVASLWILWFFGAVRLFATAFVDELVPLQIAVLRSGSGLEALVCGLLLVYLVVLCVGTCALMLWFLVKLMTQALARDVADKPIMAMDEADFDEAERASVAERLSRLPMLAVLGPDVRDDVLHGVERQRFEAGAWIRRGAARQARLYWIESGAVEILSPRPEGGHELVRELGQGDHFGEEALLDASHDCRAIDACEVLVVDLEIVKEGVAGHAPGLADVESLLERARFLKGVGPYATLDAMARLKLASELSECRVDADTMVVEEGDEAESMFVIVEGSCVVWRGDELAKPRELLAELGPREIFGEIGLLHHRERSANVSCTEKSVLLEVSAATLRDVLDRSVQVGCAFESLAASRTEARA